MVDLRILIKAAGTHQLPTELLHLALNMYIAPRMLVGGKLLAQRCSPSDQSWQGMVLQYNLSGFIFRIVIADLIEDLRILKWQGPHDLPGVVYSVTCSVHVDDVSQGWGRPTG